MLFLLNLLYAILSLVVIIFACNLFTNAIEHLGQKFKLGSNAIGSILAVIGTTLPETIVPVVAIFEAIVLKTDINNAQDIALGAIFGSPFMLSTFALFLLGVVLIIKKRKELKVDYRNSLREYKYFIFAYITAILAFYLPYRKLIAVFLVLYYLVFVYRTIVRSRKNYTAIEVDELIFYRIFHKKLVLIQIVVSIALLILSSHFFICEIKYFSNIFNINPMILSLFITPFATELPECVNSVIWLVKDKDELSLSNVLGAIVFQAVVPMCIGIILIGQGLNSVLLLNALAVVIGCLFFIISTLTLKKITVYQLIFIGLLYFFFLLLVIFF